MSISLARRPRSDGSVPNQKTTELQRLAIRRRLSNLAGRARGRAARELAAEHGLSVGYVYGIATGAKA